jgi:hypothetical protein
MWLLASTSAVAAWRLCGSAQQNTNDFCAAQPLCMQIVALILMPQACC